jgi:hypothetical protein
VFYSANISELLVIVKEHVKWVSYHHGIERYQVAVGRKRHAGIEGNYQDNEHAIAGNLQVVTFQHKIWAEDWKLLTV